MAGQVSGDQLREMAMSEKEQLRLSWMVVPSGSCEVVEFVLL